MSSHAPQWLEQVREALERAPDPKSAKALAERVLSAQSQSELERLAGLDATRLAQVLGTVCGTAPFLAPLCVQHPEWLTALLDDELERPRSARDLRADVAAALQAEVDPVRALRLAKYRALLRISVRESAPALVPLKQATEVLRELSALADALLDRALDRAGSDVAARFGPPCFRGSDQTLGFVVLALGKLGAQELNYSSDVDLVYVFEAPRGELDPSQQGPVHARLAPPDYFTRLAQRFGELVSEQTPDGFLYRIDLDLRPEGQAGALVVSDEALAVYYESWADTWEKATFTKARPVAGDLSLGWRAIHTVDPMIYRSVMDYAAVDGIRELKDKIEAAHGRREDGWNVKLDAGGIRDIEFVAQALQLLHGGRIEQVRARGTEEALERLRDVKLLTSDQAESLLLGYRFLRRLENRLQMAQERQTHRVPADPEARLQVARAFGFHGSDALARFDAELEAHRDRIRAVFESMLVASSAQRIFELFARNAPQLLAAGASRQMLEGLVERLTTAIESSGNAERALNNLDRFVQGTGGRRFYFELLLDRPELVARLCALFSSSNYLSGILARHPTLIEPVFYDPNVLLLDRPALQADFASLLQECVREHEDESEAHLAALRRFYHRQTINAGLLDLGDKIGTRELQHALTEVAEVALDRALELSRAWLAARRPELAAVPARFLVVGMGKLASRELGYGSDLDLLFLFDSEAEHALEAQEHGARLGQRLISMLETKTTEGFCYEVDTRLRPSGNQGMLVSSLESLLQYHVEQGQVWERMALLRARALCGDAELGRAFESARLRILQRPLPPEALAEVRHIRGRMERELAKERPGRRDFKRGRGGMLDVENIAQYLQLAHGATHPELFAASATDVVLGLLAQQGLVASEDAAALHAGWDFLSRLSSRLRVVENRSISDLDEERGDLEAVALGLGYPAGDRAGQARRSLLADYHRHTEAIRAAYERVLG
jgi:glutamate-ammonia-ligase adenylyltransferase